ncbi:MAG: flagellar biosynthetic protein FliR, partial [Solirubrobacteraceae bacterium]
MNQLTLNHVLTELGGGQSITAFFLVLGRVSPLFVLAPLFSAKQIPMQVRGVIAVALAIGLTGLAMHGQTIPTQPMQVAGLIIVQLLVGI